MNDRGDIDAEAVLKEISGYSWPERRQIKGFNDLKDDGSTACGSWIYCGAYPAEGHNQTRAREARSEEHTSELQSLMRISYAVFCLKKKKTHLYTYTYQYLTID